MGQRSSSIIEDELEMIPLNSANGQVLSSGLRAHKVGPKASGMDPPSTNCHVVSPGKTKEKRENAYIYSMGSVEKSPLITYV